MYTVCTVCTLARVRDCLSNKMCSVLCHTFKNSFQVLFRLITFYHKEPFDHGKWLSTWKLWRHHTYDKVKKINRYWNFCFVCNPFPCLSLSCRMWQVEERWFPELPVLLSGSHLFWLHSVHQQPARWWGWWKWKEGIHVHINKYLHFE